MTSSRGLVRGLSIVVPVYNSASSLAELVERLGSVFEGGEHPFEVLLINDGSTDASWQEISAWAKRKSWVRGIDLARNFGQHNALLCGVRAARYDVVATLDDDLQHRPEEVPKLVAKLDEGYDLVYGTFVQRQHSLGHNVAAFLLKLGLSVALGARVARIASPLRVFRTRLRDVFAENRNPSVILDVFLTWSTTRIASVPVEHRDRAEGKTTYTVGKRFIQALDLVTGHSTLPLKIASLIGFVFTLFGAALFLYILYVYFAIGLTVPGWAFVASAITLFAGAQLFALGIVGEYMARMFVRIMERPPYAVRETTDEGGEV